MRLLSTYVPKKEPPHKPMRRISSRARKETRSLVPSLRARFPRKLASRSIATCARNMGVHIPCTIPRIVVGKQKMEQRNLTSAPSRKGVKKSNPKKRSFAQLSNTREKMPNKRIMAVAIVILTQNRESDWVA